MYIRSASSPSTVLWAFHTIQPSSYIMKLQQTFRPALSKLSKRKNGTPHPIFDVYCGQTPGWMKTPLGREVDLGPGHIVLDGDPAPPRERSTAAPLFSAHGYCGHGRPSQQLLSSCRAYTTLDTGRLLKHMLLC